MPTVASSAAIVVVVQRDQQRNRVVGSPAVFQIS
jgi:hypothetical protein